MNKKNIKNLQKGALLLEMILMISVLVIILPLMARQTTIQIEKSQEILISKEILKIRFSAKEFIEDNSMSIVQDLALAGQDSCTIIISAKQHSGSMCPDEIKNAFLKYFPYSTSEFGTTTGFNFTYLLEIKIKSTPLSSSSGKNFFSIDALVVGLPADEERDPINDKDINLKRTIKIVNEIGAEGGYVENYSIRGYNWESKNEWAEARRKGSIVAKISQYAEVNDYVTRIAPPKASAKEINVMETNIYMSSNDVKNVNDLSFIQDYKSSLELAGGSGTTAGKDMNVAESDSNIVKINSNINTNDLETSILSVLNNFYYKSNNSIVFKNDSSNIDDLYFFSEMQAGDLSSQDTQGASFTTNSIETADLIEIDGRTNIKNIAADNITAERIFADKLVVDSTSNVKILIVNPNNSNSNITLNLKDFEHILPSLVIKKLNDELKSEATAFAGTIITNRTTFGEVIEAIERYMNEIYKSINGPAVCGKNEVNVFGGNTCN